MMSMIRGLIFLGGLFGVILVWKRAFISLVLLDLIGLRILLSIGAGASFGLILFLVLQVYSSALGLIILVGETRGLGADKVIVFF